jgi:uncharacterized protein (TIGR02147 family)
VKYQDYRRFIGDFYQHKKSLRSGFSFRLFAQRASLKSPNYLQLVIQKKRNLSDAMAPAVAGAMGLTSHEKRYFCALVRLTNVQSAPPDEQRKARSELLASVKQLVTKLIPKEQAIVLQSWYGLLVRELVFLPDFEPAGEWVSGRLHGLISAVQAEEALALLCRSGFLKQEKDGRWRAADPVIDTGPEGFAEAQVVALHKETLRVWSQNLEKFNADRREMGLINIPINPAQIPELQQRLRAFQEEIIGWLQAEDAPQEVIQLGVYLIPVT